MSADENENGLLARARATFEGNDWLLVGGFMLLIYVLYTVVSLILGLPLNGLVNTLNTITFLTAVYAMLALALNLHWGYTGLFNIGVAGFMAIGVYTMAMLTRPPDPGPTAVAGLGLPLWLGIVGGVLAAAFVGLIAALPALRLEADYLAIVTIAFAEIIRLTYLSTTFQEFTVAGVEMGTGGGSGIALPTNPIRAIYYKNPDNTAAGLTPLGEAAFSFFKSLGIQSTVVLNLTYTLVLIVFVALFYWLLFRVGNSPFGRVLKAIREDELAAKSLGKDTRLFKIKTFMVGCALMGLGGILWMGSQGYAYPSSFMPVQTFYIFVALIIGGAGSNTGSVLGAGAFAAFLYQGPVYLGRVIDAVFGQPPTPKTFIDAIGPVFVGNLVPILAYAKANISALRFVLLGVVLVWVMQNRPDGLLGHRTEEAASVDLGERPTGGDHE